MNQPLVKTIKLDPVKLHLLDAEDVVMVNRVRLNSKLVEYEIKNTNPAETAALRQAIKTMKDRERKSKRAIMGAEMKVGDVLRLFPDYQSLPKNSFAVCSITTKQRPRRPVSKKFRLKREHIQSAE